MEQHHTGVVGTSYNKTYDGKTKDTTCNETTEQAASAEGGDVMRIQLFK